jgi:hypothetical protein
VTAGQSQQFYSGVVIFNGRYPSSRPQGLRAKGVYLERNSLALQGKGKNYNRVEATNAYHIPCAFALRLELLLLKLWGVPLL